MRRSFFAAVSLTTLIAAAPAWAQQQIDDERTEPVETANADGQGNADAIVIGANGRVTLIGTPGPAVRVNSDHDLTIQQGSIIRINDRDADGNAVNVDGATGVQIDPGVTSNFSHSGSIILDDSDDATDSGTDDLLDLDGDGVADDPDREGDGPFAQDQNKTGVLIGAVDDNFNPLADQAAITGNVDFQTGSAINVQGQNSYGVRAVTDITGSFDHGGTVTVVGENSRGISIESDVSGDVRINAVAVTSPGGNAVSVEGDVGGGVRATGRIQSTGYRTTQRTNALLMALFENEVEAADRNDVADNLDSGSAFVIGGSVQDGVFVSNTGQITAFTGNGAAVEIRPDSDGNGDVTLGRVSLPDDFTSNRTDDDSEGDVLDYAVVNEGTITGTGIFDGKDALAFLIVGRDDDGVLRSVILEADGFSNSGTISAIAHDAAAVSLQLGEGAVSENLHNTGLIRATASIGYAEDGFADDQRGSAVAVAIQLDENSQLRRLINEAGSITATVVGGGQSATAILSNDDSLEEISNTGSISALSEGLVDGFTADEIDTIAIDARNNHGGLSVVQTQGVDDNGADLAAPSIRGDVLFGDGDDRLELSAGTMNGDVSFGAGSDVLIINNATLNGAISDADGDLVIDVTQGTITLTGSDSLALQDAFFRNEGELVVTIDSADRTAAFVDASGEILFEEGSTVSVGLDNVIGSGGTYEIVTAGTLTFENEDQSLETTASPYLYTASLGRSTDDENTLVLTLTQKTADELGMNVNQAAAYDEAMAAFETVDALGAAIAGLSTQDAFFGAYDQLLPEFSASAIQFALASNDAAAGALESRLRNARMAPDALAGIWIQEFGYFADRSSTAFGPGYRGEGVGVAVGLDRPAGPFYAVGVQAVGAASQIEEFDGFDKPMVSLTGQVGAYAAMDLGGFDLSGSVGLGYDYFETEREIRIGDFTALTEADWTGWHATASFNAGRDFGFGNWIVRPEAALTYISLFESGYTENTLGVNADDIAELALTVDDRDSSVLLGAATVSLSRRFGTETSWWAPSLRAGYRGEFSSSGGATSARFGTDGDPFTLQAEELSNSGLLVGFGLSAGSNYSTFTFAYDADVRDDFIRHVARLVIRLTF